eukprot:gene7786-8631_t
MRFYRPDDVDETDSGNGGSGSGMGGITTCDDEDGDCDRNDVIKIETGGSAVSSEKLIPTAVVSFVSRKSTVQKTVPTTVISRTKPTKHIKTVPTTISSQNMNIFDNISNSVAQHLTTILSTTPGDMPVSDTARNNDKLTTEEHQPSTTSYNDQITRTNGCSELDCNGSKDVKSTARPTKTSSAKSVSVTATLKQSTNNPRIMVEDISRTVVEQKLVLNATVSTVPARNVSDQRNSVTTPSANRITTRIPTSWLKDIVLQQNATATTRATPTAIDSKTRSSSAEKIEIHDNFVEKSSLNVCGGLLCGNGSCLDEGRNKGRCLCPMGRGGRNCNKEMNFTHPSFSGSSYLKFNQLMRFSKEFSFQIEFIADETNGLLIFGSGENHETDHFFALILVDGFLQFRFKCGPGFITISSSERIKLKIWQQVIIRKRKTTVTLQTNGASVTSWTGKCLKSEIETTLLHIGGVPRNLLQKRNIGLVEGFVGCFRKLIANRKMYNLSMEKTLALEGIDISDCTNGYCASSHCIGHSQCMPESSNTSRCLCPIGKSGPSCQKDETISIPKFSGSGFLKFTGLGSTAWSQIKIEVVVKPESQTGLILFNGDKINSGGDFISLNLNSGFVEFVFDCGTGSAVIRSRFKLALNQWHVIKASRNGKHGSLLVNNDKILHGASKGPFRMLKLREPLYIGGVEYFTDVPIVSKVHARFRGCIEKVLINKMKLKWTNSLGGYDVTNCHSHQCFQQQCSNHGHCEYHKGRTWCHCYLGFNGTRCEQETEINIPMFSGDSYLMFEDRRLLKQYVRFYVLSLD